MSDITPLEAEFARRAGIAPSTLQPGLAISEHLGAFMVTATTVPIWFTGAEIGALHVAEAEKDT